MLREKREQGTVVSHFHVAWACHLADCYCKPIRDQKEEMIHATSYFSHTHFMFFLAFWHFCLISHENKEGLLMFKDIKHSANEDLLLWLKFLPHNYIVQLSNSTTVWQMCCTFLKSYLCIICCQINNLVWFLRQQWPLPSVSESWSQTICPHFSVWLCACVFTEHACVVVLHERWRKGWCDICSADAAFCTHAEFSPKHVNVDLTPNGSSQK